jgi:hypothetical protein
MDRRCCLVVIPLGWLTSRRTRLYRYLWRSVRSFDSIQIFVDRLYRAGFVDVQVVVAGGGIAGIAAAVGLAEWGVPVIMVEPHDQLGGRVRSWPVAHRDDQVTMSRGFHAFFRQYYNLRALLRRIDPDLQSLVGVADYPLILADGHADAFASIPRTPPLNIAAFVLQSPSFGLRDLVAVNVPVALDCWTPIFRARSPAMTARVRRTSLIDFAFQRRLGTLRWRPLRAVSCPSGQVLGR